MTKKSGSSPLARGLRLNLRSLPILPGIIPARAGFTVQPDEQQLSDGIIPARAGFTARSFLGAAISRDHPRSRGVY